MATPGNHDPGAAYQQPQPGYGQPPPTGTGSTPGPQRYDSPRSPQHTSYDPHSGYPIPPGYVPPQRPPPSTGYDPNNFPPPPRQDYRDDGYGPPPRSEYDRGYDRGPPSDFGPPPSGYGHDRPYAPPESERWQHEGNQLAPYDEEIAEAEYRRGYEEQRRHNVPPPPSDYDLRERRRREGRYDDRYDDDRYDDRYYDDRERRSYDSRSSFDERDRKRSPRRRDSRQSQSKSNAKDILGGREGERGLGAQILGGAMGGIAGHEFGGGMLETLAGVAAGAIGAKVLENQHEKRKNKKEEEKRAAAPYKRDAMSPGDRVAAPKDRWPRDDRGDIKGARRRSRSRSRRRRSSDRRSDSDSYSSDGSPPPRRR